MGQPRPIFNLFWSFQTHINFFTTNRYVKKCPSSTWCQDSNSRPLKLESPPITARPGLPPNVLFALLYVELKDIINLKRHFFPGYGNYWDTSSFIHSSFSKAKQKSLLPLFASELIIIQMSFVSLIMHKI